MLSPWVHKLERIKYSPPQETPRVLTTATIDAAILRAASVHADACSFTLTALSPNQNLWDAIPRDIDTVRRRSYREIDDYCKQLVGSAQRFNEHIRSLLKERKLVVIDQVKNEVKGRRGHTNGLSVRADTRFPFAPPELVRKSLSFQMAAHDAGLEAKSPQLEREIFEAIFKRVHEYWRLADAKSGVRSEVSYADKLLFASAATNAIMIENGSSAYGDVVLVSRDFHHVYRMYKNREDILKPACKRLRLLYPRNFLFRPTFEALTRRNEPLV